MKTDGADINENDVPSEATGPQNGGADEKR
jgi:hypothetical protein